MVSVQLLGDSTQIGYIVNVANPGNAVAIQYLDAAATKLGMRVVLFKATNEA